LLNSSFIKRRSLQTQYKGGGVANLNVKVAEEFDMPVPPLKEQQKIAEILSSVDVAIEKTEQVIAKMEEIKKGLMQQLLTGQTRVKID
ncbi:restriction endonuclease subunit S, partial [Turicibacter sanguinis]|uniref:restriction endonuclease subunit S n=1 Tax=Turicibacter sanguinis TaxID=154288 RepID=UPI0018AAF5B2